MHVHCGITKYRLGFPFDGRCETVRRYPGLETDRWGRGNGGVGRGGVGRGEERLIGVNERGGCGIEGAPANGSRPAADGSRGTQVQTAGDEWRTWSGPTQARFGCGHGGAALHPDRDMDQGRWVEGAAALFGMEIRRVERVVTMLQPRRTGCASTEWVVFGRVMWPTREGRRRVDGWMRSSRRSSCFEFVRILIQVLRTCPTIGIQR